MMELRIMTPTLAEWANIATICGAVITALVLVYTAVQVRQNKVSRGQFWLELEKSSKSTMRYT